MNEILKNKKGKFYEYSKNKSICVKFFCHLLNRVLDYKANTIVLNSGFIIFVNLNYRGPE